jgi:hypothetical protein
MPTPVVSWYDLTNASPVSSWPIGTVDAGSTSAPFNVLIWNNRSGVTQLSDMINCTLTTKDTTGGDSTEPVLGLWVRAIVKSAGESAATAIGATQGAVLPGGKTGHEHPVKAGGTAAAGTISGAVNDGTKGNSLDNFAELTLDAKVPLTASAGSTNFVIRLAYQYV